MAGPLLRVLIRLKPNKYHQTQIAAKYRILDLFKQIAQDFHLKVDQLLNISIYRNSSNGLLLFYPTTNNSHSDVSMSLDSFGLSNNDELFIDLSEILLCQSSSDDELTVEKKISEPTSSAIEATKKPIVGQLIRFPVPADDSCLFSSISFVLHSGKFESTTNKYLRNLVASKIESNHSTYSEAMLGRTNSDYCKWIRRDDSWGGGIELAILSNEYELEICVINTECGGRIDRFGEDRHFPYRVYLLYNNFHYDPVYLITFDVNDQNETMKTKFHRNDSTVVSLVKDLVEQFDYSSTTSNNKSDSKLIHLKL